METSLVEIRDQQKANWNNFSGGWKKWDNIMMDFLKPMGDAIIANLQLKATDHVLDIASGTGEPGLSIAQKVLKGKVVLTDLSDDMLRIAVEHADHKAIENIDSVVCDVSELPFANASFDAVSCRFGYMFFPDMLMATNEILRVLKPGGRIATTVWAPAEKNFWVTCLSGAINKHMQLPTTPPDAPGIFRCAAEGMMAAVFERAGVRNITTQQVDTFLHCQTADVYWTMMTEVSAPVVSALNKADNTTKQLIQQQVINEINSKWPGGNVSIPASAWLVYGEK